MFLLVPAHPGCPRLSLESHKTVVCVCVCVRIQAGGRACVHACDNMNERECITCHIFAIS